MSTHADAPGAAGDELFSIERKGIDLIEPDERHGRPRDLFWMWLGSNTNIFYLVNGAVIISLGLSFAQSIAAILIGNLVFFAVGLTSLQGPKTGTSTFAVSRAAYGPNGGRALALFNWVTCVGFEASGLALVVLAGVALAGEAGVHSSTGLKIALIAVATLLQMVLPLFGHQTIMKVQKLLAWLLVPLFAAMAAVVAGKVDLGKLQHGTTLGSITVALVIVISGGGLSWANVGSDYSRYLPVDADPKAVFWWSSLGGMLPAVLLEVLGAAIASIVSGGSDPISGLPKAFPGWVVVPYLIVATVSLLAVNTVDLYSSGLSLQAVGIRLARWQCVLLDMVICVALTSVVIFNSEFNRLYGNFLSLIIVWLAPWLAIYLVDWALRRGSYDPPSLLRTRGGLYWRNGGFNPAAIAAQVVGMVAACIWIDSPAFVGPLSSRVGHSDLSFFLGFIAAGVTYLLVARKAVTPHREPAPVGQSQPDLLLAGAGASVDDD